MRAPFTAGIVLVGGLCAAHAFAAGGDQVAIVNPALHQYQGGPPVPGSFEFFPGDTVLLSCRITGYHITEEDKIRLTYQIDAMDPDGLRLKETTEGEIEAELAPEDKKSKWTPIVRYEVLIPPAAPSGVYRLTIRVKDELNRTTASQDVAFSVRGRHVEPSDTLVVRNFRFLRSETATEALAAPSYHPGDSVWARFDITGYRLDDSNRFEVDYGLSVLRSSGKILYTEDVAAEEQRESYYPQRHVPGMLSLNLTPDLALGEYTIVLMVRDRIGQQSYQTRQVFQVE